MKHYSVLLVLLATAAAPAAGTNYYVANTGDDSANTGRSLDNAYKTIQHAVDSAKAGDVVNVGDGTYGTSSWTVVDFHHQGSAPAPITLRAVHPRKAIIGHGNNNRFGIAFEPDVAHIKISGFVIEGVSESGIQIDSSNHHITVEDNTFQHIGRQCSDTAAGRTGIFVSGSHVAIVHNRFMDIGRLHAGEQSCRLETTNYMNHDHGIYISGAKHIVVDKNEFAQIRSGWAIQVFSQKGVSSADLVITENLFSEANPNRDGQIEFGPPGVSSGIVARNRFIRPRGSPLRIVEAKQLVMDIADNKIEGSSAAICGSIGNKAAHKLTLRNNVTVHD